MTMACKLNQQYVLITPIQTDIGSMKQIIVTLFLVMFVVATANSNQLPFGGGILMPNGNLIPGNI